MSASKQISRTNESADEADDFDIDVWTDLMSALGYTTDYKRAKALKMAHAVLTRLRAGKSRPGQKFIRRTVELGIPYDAVFRGRKRVS